jgi:hypothetical protein
MVFAAYLGSGLALNGLSYYGLVSGTATGQQWKKSCRNSGTVKHYSAVNMQNTFSKQNGPKKQGTVKTIPCNPSLQMLPVSSLSFTVPVRSSHSIVIDNHNLASQLFVFREPDPPRSRA